jgi:hypothetical protein
MSLYRTVFTPTLPKLIFRQDHLLLLDLPRIQNLQHQARSPYRLIVSANVSNFARSTDI